MRLKNFQIYFLILSILFLCSSCTSVDYPARTQYMLNVSNPKPTYHKPPKRTLILSNVAVVPQFASLSFVYRTSDITYLKDYYNIFFNPPEQQIEQQIFNYLRHTNLFSYVSDDINYLDANYSLQAKVLKLYADYRNSKQPKAVIQIEFTLSKTGPKPDIILSKTVETKMPLHKKDSRELVKVWNKALGKTLYLFCKNLRNLH